MRKPEEIQDEINKLEMINQDRKIAIQKTIQRIENLRKLKSKAREVEELKVGVDVNVVSVSGEWPHFLVTTDEGFQWWGRDKNQKLGKTRITQRFYAEIKMCHDKKQVGGIL